MKRHICFLILALMSTGEMMAQTKLYLTIEGNTVSATMQDNVATQALIAALEQGDITYTAHDYGGFEKVGALGRTLPSVDQQTTTQAGDIVLYNSNQVVIFYGSNSWAYTHLAAIDNATAESVRQFVKAGEGEVSITLSLTASTTDIYEAQADKANAVKTIRNGHMTIERNGNAYNAEGKRL